MNPPQFLIPFQLLGGTSFTIHEIVDTAKFFVPTIIKHRQSYILRLFNQIRTVQTFPKIHNEPHSLDIMARSNLASFERIGKFSICQNILYNNASKFRTIENFHNFMNAYFHRLFQTTLIQQMLYFHSQIT